MHITARLGLIALSGSLFLGCATIVTNKANLAQTPKGIRVYPPKIYLMVDKSVNRTWLSCLPDYSRAYDVKPVTVCAKQDFKIELDDGQLKALTSNADTTALLSFIKDSATLAAKAAGTGLSSDEIEGTFGFETGIYCLDDDGVFRRLKQP